MGEAQKGGELRMEEVSGMWGSSYEFLKFHHQKGSLKVVVGRYFKKE